VQQREETSWPAGQVWPPGSEVVTENGREFDLKYRFEDAHGDRGQHGGQRGHFRDGERTKAADQGGGKCRECTTAAAAKAASRQMDEDAADSTGGDTDDGRQADHHDGGAQPGSTTGEGDTTGNLTWVSLARAAQEAVGRMLSEEAPITAANADGGTSCRGPTALRRASGPDDNNQ
jgi:hypothetical protein